VNNSRVVFKTAWLLRMAVISIAIMALAFGVATSNKAEAQSGGPGNGGEGGGGHDLGAWEHCISTILPGGTSTDPQMQAAINAALAKLNAREAGGHNYVLIEVIACGIHSKKGEFEFAFAFRLVVEEGGTQYEKNVKVP